MSGIDRYGAQPSGISSAPQPANLADILERVLDKGIVIAGDIQINLLDIELLTIKLRLLVASVDKAKEMGIDWWEHDPTLSSRHSEMAEENRRLRDRLAALEGADDEDRDEPELPRRERREVGRAARDEYDDYGEEPEEEPRRRRRRSAGERDRD
jgi:hypothetical protein